MELFTLFGKIAVDNDQANKALKETSAEADEASNQTSSAFQKIGSVAGTIAKGIATAGVPLEHNQKWLSRVAEDLKSELQSNGFQDGNGSQILMLLNQIATLIQELKKMKICLDSGVMVGELVPAIDSRLSDRWSHAKRGNTR